MEHSLTHISHEVWFPYLLLLFGKEKIGFQLLHLFFSCLECLFIGIRNSGGETRGLCPSAPTPYLARSPICAEGPPCEEEGGRHLRGACYGHRTISVSHGLASMVANQLGCHLPVHLSGFNGHLMVTMEVSDCLPVGHFPGPHPQLITKQTLDQISWHT